MRTILTCLDRLLAWTRSYPRITQVILGLVAWYLHPASVVAIPIIFGIIQLDDVNTVTAKEIIPGVVDNYFRAGPIVAMCRSRFTRKWIGPQIQENYLFGSLKGGAYAKGASFDVTKKRTKAPLLFGPRYYQTNVTEFLEDIEVEMVGPRAAFNVIRTDMQEAAMTMSAILEIAAVQHGQNIAGDNRSLEINGLEEALNDGTNGSWDGTTFTSYGGQTRADVSPALNSPAGFQAANVAGAITYRALRHSYFSCVIGNEAPTIAVTTNRCMGFIAENFLPHQIVDTRQPEIDWPGLKLDKATIMMSQYCPGQDGTNDPDLGDYNNATETLFWLNFGPQGDDAYIRLYVAQSAKFAFGFTGFKGAREDNQVSGQLLFGGNLTVRTPRLSRILHGITA